MGLIGPNLIKLDKTGSNQIKEEQISSNQIELNQIVLNWIKRDQIAPTFPILKLVTFDYCDTWLKLELLILEHVQAC